MGNEKMALHKRDFCKKNFELHITYRAVVLKNQILVADWIELPAFNEKG